MLASVTPSVQFDTGHGEVMPCGWEGNRRYGVALVMRHRLEWLIHLRAHGQRKAVEHPAYNRLRDPIFAPLPGHLPPDACLFPKATTAIREYLIPD